jgi:hypothetical protein
MSMFGLSHAGRILAGAALLAAAVAACGEDGGSGPGESVELQVLSGIAMSPDAGHFVHVKTPRTNAFKLLGVGDQTDYDNWTKFNLNLQHGDEITISVISAAGDTLMTDKCLVALEGAEDDSYARAIAFWFDPPNNYADCADNLDFPPD